MSYAPHIVGLGGTTRQNSSSEKALQAALDHAAAKGATTYQFTGESLAQLPLYSPHESERCLVAQGLIRELRRADGVIIASPGYHGSISGLVKNALDYIEDLREESRPYLADRAVGLIVTAYGWPAAVTTLAGLRVVVHALRGWVTPYGATINALETPPIRPQEAPDADVVRQLAKVADEVLHFAGLMAAGGLSDTTTELLTKQSH